MPGHSLFARARHLTAKNPEWVIAGLTACCLLLFLATIPLPRVDGQLVGSDGVGYYVYLPSILIDHDLDFSNEYRFFYAYDRSRAGLLLTEVTPTGLRHNIYPIGPAMLWTPFFVCAHALVRLMDALGASIPPDGVSYPYQAFALSGTVLYGGIGLWLSLRAARRTASVESATLAVVVVALSGNLVYYMTAEPSMSHAMSVFATSVFVTVWLMARETRTILAACLLGAAGGLMALMRFQDGPLLAAPFLVRLPEVWRGLRGSSPAGELSHWCRDVAIAACAALVVFSPQLVVWNALYGSPFTLPHSQVRTIGLFEWSSPHFGAVLWSAERGLFTWHPVFLLAVAGLVATARRDRTIAVLAAVGLVLQWCLVSFWFDWQQGEAFGGRMFIGCTPFFAIGLASLIEWAGRRGTWTGVYTVGAALIGWNALLFVEYRLDLATAHRAATWFDIGARRLIFVLERLRPGPG
jgi:hypothetical protein